VPPGRGDRGVGTVSSVAGLLVFLVFLLLAAQVLIGLYATSTVRATLNAAASRAASTGADGRPADLARLAAEAEGSLGRMGARTTITLSYVDDDGDGAPDVVAGRAVARPPGFLPRSFRGVVGADRVDVAVRVRVERYR
jgi:Flp pilus assembly protein TadG